MSVVTIQLGQCGNQVGHDIFNTLAKEADSWKDEDLQNVVYNRYFRPDIGRSNPMDLPVARACLIDMEPKVIQHIMQDAKAKCQFLYPQKSYFYKQGGSGNNWAYGYNTHGPSSAEAIREIVRKEVELCDHFGGFLLISSLAGGTGSGVGAYVTEMLRDEYPSSFLFNQVIWPYETGEVIVQNYNSVLTLSKLCEVSDAIVVFENDQLNLVCTQLLRIQRPSFADMNGVMARSIANILLPSFHTVFEKTPLYPAAPVMNDPRRKGPTLSSPSQQQQSQPEMVTSVKQGDLLEMWKEPVQHLCAHPGYKILSTKSIPQIPSDSVAFSSHIWSGLLKHLHQMLIADSKIEENINWSIKAPVRPSDAMSGSVNKSIANLLILRGKELATADAAIPSFQNPYIYCDWYHRGGTGNNNLMLCTSNNTFDNYDKCATLLSNSQSIVQPLNRVLDRAFEMFASKAYLHQYKKHNFDEHDFEDYFVSLEQVLHNYRTM